MRPLQQPVSDRWIIVAVCEQCEETIWHIAPRLWSHFGKGHNHEPQPRKGTVALERREI